MCNAEDWEIDRGASENVIFCFMNQQDEHSKPACPRVNDKGQKNQVSVKVTPRNTSAMQTSPPLSVRPFITAWPAPSTPESGGTKLIPLIQAIELPPLAGPPSVMNVIVVAAEYAPWSKTGALGDVVRSLPKALSCRSHNIRVLFWEQVVAPQYTNYADAWETGIWKIYNVSGQVPCSIPYRGVCYGHSNLVFIASDWHPALLPIYLQVYYRDNGLMEFIHSILVIHNMALQSGILSWIPALRVMATITYSLDTLPLGKPASKAVLQREPGLPVCNELYAMRYGTVLVVHSVGGLQEIVQPLDPFTASGMGWTFDRAEVGGFTDALKNAMWTYCDFKNNLDWHKGSTECHRIQAGTMQLSSMRKCYMAAKYSQ
ncbi:unnamed protein product [Sphagnum jensenii]|uniref:Starch synthase catalytic domain-containing protein n=1 Tax=Sphagnum jensenii TaxID=128206 RepID=A0ABP0XAW3_9BRYO